MDKPIIFTTMKDKPITKDEWLTICSLRLKGHGLSVISKMSERTILDVRWCLETALADIAPETAFDKRSVLEGEGDAHLVRWYRTHKTTPQLAAELSELLKAKVTKNMVIGRAHRLGLSAPR